MSNGNIFDRLSSYSREVPEGTSTLRPSERFIENLESRGFNMSDLVEVLKTKGNQQIVSCAGSGKTTSLIFKILYDTVTGETTSRKEINGQTLRMIEPIWVSTFLKSGAEELQSSIWAWQKRLSLPDITSTIKFSTIHAEFKGVLNSLGVGTNFIDTKKNNEYLKSLMREYHVNNGNVNSEVVREFASALTYTRNRLDHKRYENETYREFNVSDPIVDVIIKEWANKRLQNGLMDFEDLQDLLYKFAVVDKDPRVISAIQSRYKYLYVDEFQDTSQIQYEILKVYAEAAKKVIVIGDDDQTIYTWRGSSHEIITSKFTEDYDPTITKLGVNYRCPSNVLNPIIPSIEKNVDRLDKDITSFNEGGELRIGDYGSYKSMVYALNKGIESDLKAERTVAVLCRDNVDGLVPALLLDKMGNNVKYSISGENMSMDSYIGRQVMGIIKLFTAKHGEGVRRALSQLAPFTRESNLVNEECKSSGMNIWQLDSDDFAYSAPKIWAFVARWREFLSDSESKMETLKFVLNEYKYRVYGRQSKYNEICCSVIDAVLALIESGKYDDPLEVLLDIEDINERLNARLKLRNATVKISTVHNFKGKEADSVYVWNDSFGVFPPKDSASIEEERRIHYIACTRALKISTLLCKKDSRSPFVGEMDLSSAKRFTETGLGMAIGSNSTKEDDSDDWTEISKVV